MSDTPTATTGPMTGKYFVYRDRGKFVYGQVGMMVDDDTYEHTLTIEGAPDSAPVPTGLTNYKEMASAGWLFYATEEAQSISMTVFGTII